MKQGINIILRLLKYLLQQISDHNVFNLAATLAFTSLLAIVPLFTVVFAFVSELPLVQGWAEEINHFILSSFIPDVGTDVEGIMTQFINNALAMQWWGYLFLVLTAIMLIATIDKAMHIIWHEARKRTALSSILIYWSVLLLTPITLGVSLATTSYIGTMSWMELMPEDFGLRWTLIFPMLVAALGIMLLYKTIPSSKVKTAHAFWSAIFASFLFEISKRLFSLYIEYFPVQEAIFGALAAIPLILIWLYVTWLIILLGAELCHALGSQEWRSEDSRSEESHSESNASSSSQ